MRTQADSSRLEPGTRLPSNWMHRPGVGAGPPLTPEADHESLLFGTRARRHRCCSGPDAAIGAGRGDTFHSHAAVRVRPRSQKTPFTHNRNSYRLLSTYWDLGWSAADCRWSVLEWGHGGNRLLPPAAPPGCAARRTRARPPSTRCCGRPRPPRRSSTPSPPARPCARTWPPSRPPRWPRSRTARSPRPSSPGPRPATGTPTPPAPTPAPDAAPCATPSSSSVTAPDPGRAARRPGLPRTGRHHLDAIEELPTDPHLRELAEKTLLDEAGRLHATDLAKAARHLIHVVDPEGAERKAEKDLARQDRAAHLGRFLAITEDGAGGVRLRGRGTVEDAAKIKAALLPLTKPTPAAESGPGDGECGEVEDVRDHGARMWDALVATCEHALATDLPPGRARCPAPGRGHPQPRRPQGPGRLVAGHRRRHRAVPRRRPPAGVRRRHHPRRPRHPQRGVGRRPGAPPGHPRPVAGPGLPRPALRVPRLHPTPGDGPRPPPHPLGRRWPHLPGQPGAAVRAPPPDHPLHPVAGPAQRGDGRPEFLPPPKPGRHHPAPEWIRQRPRRE